MALNREELLTCLSDLIETCRDAEKGFKSAAENIQDDNLRAFFRRHSLQRAQFASELQAEVRRLGGEPAEGGSVSGAFHRGWMNLRAAIADGDEDAIVGECEWGEDAALRNYERVLKQSLPPNVWPVVKHQYTRIRETHDRLRDRKKAA